MPENVSILTALPRPLQIHKPNYKQFADEFSTFSNRNEWAKWVFLDGSDQLRLNYGVLSEASANEFSFSQTTTRANRNSYPTI